MSNVYPGEQSITVDHAGVLDPAARDFYVHTLELLREARVPFLLGGAYAFAQYTGIIRHTKDLDIFVDEAHADAALKALRRAGYEAKLTFPHWLGKAYCGENFVDVIFNSGNGVSPVDAAWFRHAEPSDVFGVAVLLIPAEEMIWQKALIQERERYDGADVAHLIRARGDQMNWARLIARFGDHWRVLLSHLVLYGFIYPGQRQQIPGAVLDELIGRLAAENNRSNLKPKLCNGTLLSRKQYLTDVQRWGYLDGRQENGHMMADDIALWTAAIDKEA